MNFLKLHKIMLIITPIALILSVSSPALAITVNYNNLISDPVFDNYGTMTASQIDSFLNSFPSSCISTNKGFSAVDPIGYNPTNGFTYGGAVSAGRVIYDAAHAYEINPEVLLATIQKEQGYVVGPGYYDCSNSTSSSAKLGYTQIVGYGCPDGGTTYSYSNLSPALYYINGSPVRSVSGTCVKSATAAGFTQQIIRAAWLLKFNRERSEGKVNWAIIKGNWDNSDDLDTTYYGYMTQGTWQRCSSCAATYYDGYATIDSSAVHMDSGATASLYVYTPHKSGNSHFVTIFSSWFGSTTGSILFKVSGSSTYYLEWGGYYYPVPSTEMLYAYGLASITPRTVSALPSDETQGPVLTRVAKFGSDNSSDPDYTTIVDVVDSGLRHDAPNSSTLGAHGYSSYVNFPASLSWELSPGSNLMPVVRQPDGSIYLMQSGKKRVFPDWNTYATLSGPNYAGVNQVYSQQSLTNISATYIGSKPDGAPMLLDGKFIQFAGSTSIYLYDNGLKYGFSPSSYAAWGRRTDYVFSSTSNQIPDGPSAPILVSSSSGAKYLVDGGSKRLFGSAVESAWGLIDSQFTTLTDSAIARLNSAYASSLVKVGATIYYINSGQVHGIPSMSDFYGLGFSWSDVIPISNYSLSLVPYGPNLFASGALVRTPNGAVFLINSAYKALWVTSGAQFSRFGFSWSNVRNIASGALSGYIENPLQTLLKSNTDGSYYEIEGGVKHLADSTAFGASEYNMATWPLSAVDSRVLTVIKTGPQLTQFIRGSGPTVYYIQNGQKHGISSEAKFYSLGGSWDKVVNVSDAFLSEIPTGAAA